MWRGTTRRIQIRVGHGDKILLRTLSCVRNCIRLQKVIRCEAKNADRGEKKKRSYARTLEVENRMRT